MSAAFIGRKEGGKVESHFTMQMGKLLAVRLLEMHKNDSFVTDNVEKKISSDLTLPEYYN